MLTATTSFFLFSGCKKNNVSNNSKRSGSNTLSDSSISSVGDSAKIIYLGQRDFPNSPVGANGTVISSYNAATGALINTFNYPHDVKAASYNSCLQFLSLQVGNGFLYDIESDKINALDLNTGAIRWTDSINNNTGAILHNQTLYGINVGGVAGFNKIASTTNYVYAVEATGKATGFLWTYPISLSGIAFLNVPNMYQNIPTPICYYGLVYVMSDATHLIALDATTGKLRWTFTFPPYANINPYYAFSTPIISNGTIYCSDNLSTYLLDAATGIQKSLLSSSGVPLAIANNLIISPGGAFDITTGSTKWNTTGIGSVFGQRTGAVIAERDSIFYLYRPGLSNTNAESLLLCALNINTGQEKWVISNYFDTYLYNGVIVNNSMYVTTTRIDAIDMYTGKIKWSNNNVPGYSIDAICVVGASGRAYSSNAH